MYAGKKIAKPIIFSIFMLLLIINPQCSFNAALEGIDLCIRTVIPGIFPLLFLSSLIAGELRNLPLVFIEHVLHIPGGTGGLFLVSLICGYPVGAKLLQNEINKKNICPENATRMATFCNNASPAFIIGILAPIFGSVWYAIALWFIQISGSIILGILLSGHMSEMPVKKLSQNTSPGVIMLESLKTVCTICGWIILFGILLAYLKTPLLIYLGSIPKAMLCGILELTNGMHTLQYIYSPSIRFILCSILLSFGGLCILLQTMSVAPSINIKEYIYRRLFHASITATLASIFSIVYFPSDTAAAYCMPLIITIFVMSLLIFLFNKKMVAIKEKI